MTMTPTITFQGNSHFSAADAGSDYDAILQAQQQIKSQITNFASSVFTNNPAPNPLIRNRNANVIILDQESAEIWGTRLAIGFIALRLIGVL